MFCICRKGELNNTSLGPALSRGIEEKREHLCISSMWGERSALPSVAFVSSIRFTQLHFSTEPEAHRITCPISSPPSPRHRRETKAFMGCSTGKGTPAPSWPPVTCSCSYWYYRFLVLEREGPLIPKGHRGCLRVWEFLAFWSVVVDTSWCLPSRGFKLVFWREQGHLKTNRENRCRNN
jgi:hypothetical protein